MNIIDNLEYMSQLNEDKWQEGEGYNQPLTKKEIILGIIKAAIAAPILWAFVWLMCAIANAFMQ